MRRSRRAAQSMRPRSRGLLQRARGLAVLAGALLAGAAAVAAETGEWGTRPYEQEHPRYEARVERLHARLVELDARYEQLAAARWRYWSDWPEHEREAAREWFESSSLFDPALKARLEATRDAYEHAWHRWSTQRILTLPINLRAETPTARAGRRFLWRYNLARLRRRIEYMDAKLAYERLELRALRQYSPPLSRETSPRAPAG